MDLEKAKRHIGWINYAEHMGDVARELPGLCEALDLPVPVYCEKQLDQGYTTPYAMGWEEED